MRFMMLVKGNHRTEAGVLPDEQQFEAMAKYTASLIRAGVLLDAAGLQPTRSGAKVVFTRGKPAVVDGPFSEAEEVVAGFWILQVKSRDDAIEWAKRCPFSAEYGFDGAGEIEVRQLFEDADFGSVTEAHDRLTREAEAQ